MRILLLLVALVGAAQAVVVALDIGQSSFKAALVKPGAPFSIVTNVHSKRKTETMMGWHQNERSFGGDAVTMSTRKPQKTFTGVRGYLGRSMDHPWVQSLPSQYVATEVSWNDTVGGLQLKHPEDDRYILAQELMAMVLGHAQEITDAFSESAVKDTVLTVPSFYTEFEREALMQAADIAGFNVLSLIDENSAAAVQYGIDRLFENTTHTVMYYNMGASSLQVSIVRYGSYELKKKVVGGLTTLAKTWDDRLGGNDFDLRITEYLADDFNRQVGGDFDVRTVPRPMAKIRKQAEKVKTILSANPEIPVHIAGLWDDRDFASHLSRAQFEQMSEDLFQRALEPVKQALDEAGLEKEDIDAVEFLGGGSRVPRLQTVLREFFGPEKELGAHLNTDEAPALGAAFHAANLSVAFRVRHVGLTDVSPFAVDAELTDLPVVNDGEGGGLFDFLGGGSDDSAEGESDEEKWVKRASPFPRYSKFKSPKKVAFTHDRDIAVSFRYAEDEDKLPLGHDRQLSEYSVTGIAEFNKFTQEKGLGEPKVHLTFALGGDGIVRLAKAEATAEEEIIPVVTESTDDAEESAEEPAGDGSGDGSGDSDDSEDSEEDQGEGNGEEAAEDDGDADAAGDSEGEEGEGDGEGDDQADGEKKSSRKSRRDRKKKKKEEKEEDTGPKIKTHRRQLTIKRRTDKMVVKPLTDVQISQSKAYLRALKRADDERRENAAAKNDLESFLYATKGRMWDDESAVEAVSTEEQRQAVFDLVDEIEDWLYGDGDDETATVYKGRKRELSRLADAIFNRMAEAMDRPAAVAGAREALQATREKLVEWAEERPQITEDDHQDVNELIDEIERWLQEKLDEQNERAAHEEPAFSSSDVADQMKRLQSLIKRLARKPKPEPPKPEVNATDTDADAGNSTVTVEDEATQGTTQDSGASDEETAGSSEQAGEQTGEQEGEDDHGDEF